MEEQPEDVEEFELAGEHVTEADVDLEDRLADGTDAADRLRYELIGRAIGAGAGVEDGVRRLVRVLQGDPTLGRITFNKVLNKALALVAAQTVDDTSILRKYLSADETRALTALLSGLQDAMDKRNNLAHGMLGQDASGTRWIIKQDSGGPTEMELNTADENDLYELYRDLDDLWSQLVRYEAKLSR